MVEQGFDPAEQDATTNGQGDSEYDEDSGGGDQLAC